MLPVTPADTVDFTVLDEELEILCAGSLAGIYSNGTACEFHDQTEDEFDRLSEMVAFRARRAGKPFQIGVSNTNPRLARERLARIVSLAPDGVQITLPDWWPPSREERRRFVEGMAEVAGDVPLILYNPPHAKVILDLEEIAALRAAAPSLVGVKVLGGNDADWYDARRRLLPDFSVFVAGTRVAFGRPLGADGSYSNLACLSPEGAVRHWKMIESDPEAARNLEARFNAFLRDHLLPLATDRGLSNAALDKAMAAAGGWGPLGPRLLWPYEGATDDEVAALSRAARSQMPELFG